MSAPALAPNCAWLVVAALVLAWFGASGPHPFDAGDRETAALAMRDAAELAPWAERLAAAARGAAQ